MWGFISAQLALSHPVMEFDFAGPDFWILGGGTSKEEYELVPIGKRNDTVKTWAAQAETARTKFLHGYAGDSSGWKAPQWASLDGMLSPQVDKAPWLAAWHGLMRAMIASENICGDMSGQESRLSMLFHSYARQEERTMPRLRFEQLMRETGHGRLLVAEYVKKFQEAVDRKVAAAVKKALAAREKLEAAAAAAAAKAEGGASQGEGGGARGGRRQGSIKAQGSMKALASIKGEQSLSSLPSRKQVAGLPPPAPSAERSMREIASMSKEASVRASMRGLAAEASAPAVLGNAAAPPAPQAEPSKLSPLELLGKAGLQQAEELNYSEFVDVFMLQLNPPKPRMAVAFPWMSLGAATSKFAAAEAELNDLLSAGAAN